MAEPNEGSMEHAQASGSIPCESRHVQVISEQRYVKAPRVDNDSDYDGCVLARKSTSRDR